MKNIVPRKKIFNTTHRAHNGQREQLGIPNNVKPNNMVPHSKRVHLNSSLLNTVAETQCNTSNRMSSTARARAKGETHAHTKDIKSKNM